MLDLLSGGEWEKGGSSVGHREDQSSRGRCDLCLQRRHFQKAAMILVRKNTIDFYFKSITRLLWGVRKTLVESRRFQGWQGTPEWALQSWIRLSFEENWRRSPVRAASWHKMASEKLDRVKSWIQNILLVRILVILAFLLVDHDTIFTEGMYCGIPCTYPILSPTIGGKIWNTF